MVQVRHAKAAARQWVNEHASWIDGFAGAYLAGSAGWLPDDAILSPASDVDIMVVLSAAEPPVKPGKFTYQGVLLEVSFISRALLRSPDQVLGEYHLAAGLRASTLIADPVGHLAELQAMVAASFADHEWVVKRCQQPRDKVRAGLQQVRADTSEVDQILFWVFPTGVTTHILLTAGLRNPTVRKRYVAVRDLLADYGHLDLYDPLLDLLGCAGLSRERVASHLDNLTPLFDAAARVSRTPFPFRSDITPAARPIAIDGSWELIARGDHREAVFWIVVTFARCLTILEADAPVAERERHIANFQALRDDLGIRSFADPRRRCQDVEALLPRIWEVAESIVAANPVVGATSRIVGER